MVLEGFELFEKMEEYGFEKNYEYYVCMIDLYSRVGFFNKAIKVIKIMFVELGKDVYGVLFGACRIYNNIEFVEEVVKKLFDLDFRNLGRYFILVKMYEDVGRYEDVVRLRKRLREKNIRRLVGYSEIEVDYIFYRFGVEVEVYLFKDQIVYILYILEVVIEDEEIIVD